MVVMTAPPLPVRARQRTARKSRRRGRRAGAESPGPVLKGIRASQAVMTRAACSADAARSPVIWLTVILIVRAGATGNGGDNSGQRC
jgi:hypothetical protein